MGEDSDVPVPASIAAAWGRAERPVKGPRPGLSLTGIVDAAITVATTDGLAAVSMGRVARELGAAPMSLYRHVDSKRSLLDLMVDRVYGEPPPPSSAAEGWRVGLTRWALAAQDVLMRHPWVVRVPIAGPPVTPNQVGWMDSALRSMAPSRLTEGEKVSVLLLLSGFVRNEVALVVSMSVPEEEWDYGAVLAVLADPVGYPAIHTAIDAGVFSDGEPGELGGEFTFGLDRILDGVAALEEGRQP